MRILVTGGTGQVGTELQRISWPAGTAVLAPGRDQLDLAAPQDLAAALDRCAPDVLVNCAAYTAVDKAESDTDAAMAVNAAAPEAMARWCTDHGAALIQLSTDYVFDGTKPAPYVEDDPTGPLNVYGRSKLAGEQAVRAALERHVILRTSWVYAAHGANFVRTMLRLGRERKELSIVADQHGCPTWAGDIAAVVTAITARIQAGTAEWGTFHYSGARPATWYDFAAEIFFPERRPRPVLKPIPTAAYPTPARRPASSVLDCGKIRRAYGVEAVPWQHSLARVLSDLAT
ncbi:MAG: dTDP-4-dehydrorhamnose reductase [Magnetospirillum sp.]|nr:dTDP-4-dehydrorhamnose reductase [Magnetospirillum sp.]